MPETRIQSISWLNANAQRNYPLDDQSSRVDDAGKELPNSLLCDLNLWMPKDLATTAFISSVTLSPSLISITICGHDTRAPQDAGVASFIPLAALTVTKPALPGRNYPLTGFAPGIGGWLSLGFDVNNLPVESYRFSDPAQSTLLPRNVRAYPAGGVTSLGKPGVTQKLQGIVKIRSANPDLLVIEKGSELINGQIKDCIVFRLNEAVAGRDVYSKFVGPCAGNPESLTCKGTPIHSIDGATPFCDGVLEVFVHEITADNQSPDMVFSFANTRTDGFEPATATDPNSGHTLAIDYAKGLKDVCPPKDTGFINDATDNCDDPCKAWSAASPLPVICFSWSTGIRKEPFYDGGKTFRTFSPLGDIDTTGMTSIVFNGSSDDITVLFPAGQTVTQSPDDAGYTRGAPVVLGLPPGAIIFNNTSGWLNNDKFDSETQHLPANAQKTLLGGNQSYTIPQGNADNNATGQVSELANGGFSVIEWGTAISIDTLRSRGFMQGNHFKFQFCHIVSGWGFANVTLYCQEVPSMVTCTAAELAADISVPIPSASSSIGFVGGDLPGSSSSSPHSSSSSLVPCATVVAAVLAGPTTILMQFDKEVIYNGFLDAGAITFAGHTITAISNFDSRTLIFTLGESAVPGFAYSVNRDANYVNQHLCHGTGYVTSPYSSSSST